MTDEISEIINKDDSLIPKGIIPANIDDFVGKIGRIHDTQLQPGRLYTLQVWDENLTSSYAAHLDIPKWDDRYCKPVIIRDCMYICDKEEIVYAGKEQHIFAYVSSDVFHWARVDCDLDSDIIVEGEKLIVPELKVKYVKPDLDAFHRLIGHYKKYLWPDQIIHLLYTMQLANDLQDPQKNLFLNAINIRLKNRLNPALEYFLKRQDGSIFSLRKALILIKEYSGK